MGLYGATIHMRARVVSLNVTNITRRYTHRHKYAHLHGRFILFKIVFGAVALLIHILKGEANRKLSVR